MAIVYPTSSLIGAGTQISTTTTPSISSGDTLIIDENIRVISLDGTAIWASGTLSTLHLDINGYVAGEDSAIHLSDGGEGEPTNFRLIVSDTGDIVSTHLSAVYLEGGNGSTGYVTNDGHIRSFNAVGIWAYTQGISSVTNTGIIESQADESGVGFENAIQLHSAVQVVENSGTIANVIPITDPDSIDQFITRSTICFRGGGASPAETFSYLTNSGEILSQGMAVYGDYGAVEFSNSGLIRGDIRVTKGSDTFQNSGEIIGDIETVTENDVFTNTGIIRGYVDLGDDSDQLSNSGTIFGNVTLEAGTHNRVSNDGDIYSANPGNGVSLVGTGSAGDTARFSNTGLVESDAFVGISLTQAERVVFDNSGIVNHNSADLSGSYIMAGVYLWGTTQVFRNTGLVTNEATPDQYSGLGDAAAATAAVWAFGYTLDDLSITTSFFNSGEILSASLSFASDYGDVHFTNTGNMSGGVSLLKGEDIFRNTGTITGDINLNTQDDKLTNGGVITGNILLGDGSDTLVNQHTINGYIDFGDDTGTLRNTGLIDGIVSMSDFGDQVINTGTIIGTLNVASGQNVVRNLDTGIISAGLVSGAMDDFVRNTGIIELNVELGAGADYFDGRGGVVLGSINGEDGDDTLFGGQSEDTIFGGNGNNLIRGLDGDDYIESGNGADTIYGGLGLDSIVSGAGDDIIRGGGGDDDINAQGGVDNVFGGDGNDFIRLGNGDGQRGEGNGGDDRIVGGNQKDVILGGADEDELFGQGGDDVLRGGIGDDVLEGGTGDDRLIGNAGEDTAVFSGDSSDYTFTLNGNGTVDVVDTVGTDGTDNLFGVEYVEFTDGTYLLAGLV